jgi:hypothetical protein
MRQELVVMFLASSVAACGVLPAPESGISREGDHWVKLSTDENLLDEVSAWAESAGCRVHLHGEGPSAAHGVAVDCDRDVVRISQDGDVLRYRCGELHGADCESLMESLAPKRGRRCF